MCLFSESCHTPLDGLESKDELVHNGFVHGNSAAKENKLVEM